MMPVILYLLISSLAKTSCQTGFWLNPNYSPCKIRFSRSSSQKQWSALYAISYKLAKTTLIIVLWKEVIFAVSHSSQLLWVIILHDPPPPTHTHTHTHPTFAFECGLRYLDVECLWLHHPEHSLSNLIFEGQWSRSLSASSIGGWLLAMSSKCY